MIEQIANGAYLTNLIGMYAARGVIAKKVIRNQNERLKYFTKNVSKRSKEALGRLNFDVQVKGFDKELMSRENFLLVCNHMSYLDILVVSSVLPSVFVTSNDLKESGFLGTLAELGGSIFIERRNRSQIEKDLEQMTATLKDGFNIMIYPEGTSSNGDSVLPFKKSLLMSAVFAGKDIIPVCLKYREINGKAFSPENRDQICWYGDMDFIPHFLQLLKTKKVVVELEFLNVVTTTPESTRNDLANQCYDQISAAYSRK